MGTQTTSTLPAIQPSLAVDDALKMDEFNQRLIAQFRANAGQLTGQFSGAPRNPDWYHNLLAQRLVAQWPMAADYAQVTTRRIPVIVLERGGN
jgi:hypothetical protein